MCLSFTRLEKCSCERTENDQCVHTAELAEHATVCVHMYSIFYISRIVGEMQRIIASEFRKIFEIVLCRKEQQYSVM